MKMSTLRGMAYGVLLSSAVCACYGMMPGHTQRKLKRTVNGAAHRMMTRVCEVLPL